MQNNNFRSATSLRSLGRSPTNNTFATATNLGNIPSNATRVTFRTSGSVGKFDNVDFYKFTLPPGDSMSSGRESYRLRGGLITASKYAEVQGQRFLLDSKFTIPQGSTSQTTFLKNPNQVPATFYLKLEHRSNKTRYNFTLDFFR
jgi:hypothetical protein